MLALDSGTNLSGAKLSLCVSNPLADGTKAPQENREVAYSRGN